MLTKLYKYVKISSLYYSSTLGEAIWHTPQPQRRTTLCPKLPELSTETRVEEPSPTQSARQVGTRVSQGDHPRRLPTSC